MAGVQLTVLIAVVDRHLRPIDRQAHAIGTNAVHLGVGIGEQTALQQTVLGRLDTRHEIGRRHGDLLGFLEDVVRIPVQHHLADLALGHVRPDLGGIQRIEFELGQILRLEHLDHEVPFGVVAVVDGGDQIAAQVTVVLALHRLVLFRVEVLQALLALPAEFHVVGFALLVDELVGVHTVAIHHPVAGRGALVGVQQGQGAGRLGVVREEVEAAAVVIQVGARVRLEGVDHVRELDRVADEEGREVVADQVPVAVGGVELGGEAARVAQRFRRVQAVHHGRETDEHRRAAALLEDLGQGQVGDVFGGGELAVGAGATGMHNALGDTLATETLQLLQ